MKKLATKTLMAGVLTGLGTFAADAQSPKIVVGIVVDQLRTDYLEQLRPYFGDSGFKRLMTDGLYLTDVDFRNTVTDAPAGTAVVYTGAWPSANGVAAAERLEGTLKKNVPTLASDPSKLKFDFSPENIRLSTIADEFYITNGNLSKIYSIGGDPQVAVIAAGHAGTGAVWMDETNARWTTPAYYGQTPTTVGNRNRINPLSSRITASYWKPLHAASHYAAGRAWTEGDFNYGFSSGNRDAYTRFKASPLFNTEATDVAIELLKSIKNSSLGQSNLVNVAYSLAPVGFDYDGDSRPELVDSYMRLDADIARLFETLDRDYGRENTLVFLSSTGYATEPQIPEQEAKIPTGEVTLKKVESLLNAFLSASYGNADYVALIKDGKLFLDTKEIERKGIDMKALRTDAKEFLLKMGGVADAITIDEAMRSDSRRAQDMALGIDPKNTPDLFLFFNPGWTVTDDNAFPAVSHKVRLSSPSTPAFILGPDIEADRITTRVDATVLAPTIASAINIRAPNGAASKPLTIKTNK